MTFKRKGYLFVEGLCVLLTLIMGLFVCENNSPLVQGIGVDNAIFLLTGKGITQGLIPYVDLVENKGPVFFGLMAIPQLFLDGTVGVFLVQEIMLAGACVMLFAMARWLVGEEKHLPAAILPLIVYLHTISFNNFCEEYSVFLTLLGLCMLVHAAAGRTKGQGWRAAVIGACVAAVALIKLSDLPGLGVIALFYLLWTIRQKRGAVKETLRFLGGAALVCVPVMIWLWRIGALQAMWQEYILNNFIHVAQGKGELGFVEARLYLLSTDYGWKTLLPVLLMGVALLVCRLMQGKNGFRTAFGLLFAAANFATAYVASTGFHQHRFMGSLTMAVAALMLLTALLPRIRFSKALSALALAALVAATAIVVDPALLASPGGQEKAGQERELAEDIEDYKESIYTIGVYPDWYWYNDAFPAYRYFNIIGFIDDNVGAGQAEAFETFLMEEGIEMLVVNGGIEKYREWLTNETVEYILNNYELWAEDSAGKRQLLRYI